MAVKYHTILAIVVNYLQMLAIVVMAAERGPSWEGQLIFYVTDNSNTQCWLRKRVAKNALARHLLRMLLRVEARHNFKVAGLFIRTYHNSRADWLTREDLPAIRAQMREEGFRALAPPLRLGRARRRCLHQKDVLPRGNRGFQATSAATMGPPTGESHP